MEPHLTLDQAAARLGVSRRVARRLVDAGDLEAYRLGRRLMIHKESVDTLPARNSINPKGHADA